MVYQTQIQFNWDIKRRFQTWNTDWNLVDAEFNPRENLTEKSVRHIQKLNRVTLN